MAGTTLTGSTPSTTYDALLKVTNNGPVSGSLQTITDGLGNDTALQLSSAGVKSTGTLDSAGAAVMATTLSVTGATTLAGGLNTPLVGAQGGTGVANSGKTVTLGGNLVTSGASSLTLTTTGATNVTLPTAGTVATLAGSETFTNKTITGATITGGSVTGMTDIAVADGGTGSSTASGARTNLGLGTIATQDAGSVSISGGTASLSTVATSSAATIGGGFGCNGASPQGKYNSGYAYPLNPYGSGAYGFDTENKAFQLYDMVDQIRAALIANGIMLQ